MTFDETKFQFFEICSLDDIPAGERLFVEIEEWKIVLINIDGEVFALEDKCTHDYGPLGEGELIGYQISCPRHGARFDIRSGKALTLPAITPTKKFPIQINAGMISLGIPSSKD